MLSGTKMLTWNSANEFGKIVPTSQCVWSKITFSRFFDFEVAVTEVWSFFKIISTLDSGAVPPFETCIVTSLFVSDVMYGVVGVTFTILSPVSLKLKSKKSCLTPDSLSLDYSTLALPE